MQYFEVKIKYKSEDSKTGKIKFTNEVILVDSMTITESEAKVVKYLKEQGETRDYEIVGSNESKIKEVVK
jgi:hypothetical protein